MADPLSPEGRAGYDPIRLERIPLLPVGMADRMVYNDNDFHSR
jgi:hypothetical protein